MNSNVAIFNSTLLCIVGPWYPQIYHQLIESADAEQYNMKSQLYYTILSKRLKHPRILVSTLLLLLLSSFSCVQLCAIQRDLETSSLRILGDMWTWILQENRVQGFLSHTQKKKRDKGKWKESNNCRRRWIC